MERAGEGPTCGSFVWSNQVTDVYLSAVRLRTCSISDGPSWVKKSWRMTDWLRACKKTWSSNERGCTILNPSLTERLILGLHFLWNVQEVSMTRKIPAGCLNLGFNERLKTTATEQISVFVCFFERLFGSKLWGRNIDLVIFFNNTSFCF